MNRSHARFAVTTVVPADLAAACDDGSGNPFASSTSAAEGSAGNDHRPAGPVIPLPES